MEQKGGINIGMSGSITIGGRERMREREEEEFIDQSGMLKVDVRIFNYGRERASEIG